MRKWIRWITIAPLSGALLTFAVSRTDTRLAIYLNHGMWMPSSTKDIAFNGRRNFLGIDGDGSVVYFKVLRSDFEKFTMNQQWCSNCYGQGPFISYPQSLIGKYPMTKAEFKAPKGDVLLIYADTMANSRLLKVGLYTDWN